MPCEGRFGFCCGNCRRFRRPGRRRAVRLPRVQRGDGGGPMGHWALGCDACCSPCGYCLAPGCCEYQRHCCDNSWAGYCQHRARVEAFWARAGVPKLCCRPAGCWGAPTAPMPGFRRRGCCAPAASVSPMPVPRPAPRLEPRPAVEPLPPLAPAPASLTSCAATAGPRQRPPGRPIPGCGDP